MLTIKEQTQIRKAILLQELGNNVVYDFLNDIEEEIAVELDEEVFELIMV